MSDLFKFLGPWVQWFRDRASTVNRKRLKRGEYGNAAQWRAWRLEEEQRKDNAEGRFGRVSFKVGQ